MTKCGNGWQHDHDYGTSSITAKGANTDNTWSRTGAVGVARDYGRQCYNGNKECYVNDDKQSSDISERWATVADTTASYAMYNPNNNGARSYGHLTRKVPRRDE